MHLEPVQLPLDQDEHDAESIDREKACQELDGIFDQAQVFLGRTDAPRLRLREQVKRGVLGHPMRPEWRGASFLT